MSGRYWLILSIMGGLWFAIGCGKEPPANNAEQKSPAQATTDDVGRIVEAATHGREVNVTLNVALRKGAEKQRRRMRIDGIATGPNGTQEVHLRDGSVVSKMTLEEFKAAFVREEPATIADKR